MADSASRVPGGPTGFGLLGPGTAGVGAGALVPTLRTWGFGILVTPLRWSKGSQKVTNYKGLECVENVSEQY